jgi:glycerophosphoryl diester phosphodiesterase
MQTTNLFIHPPIIAHRGVCALLPENTLSAFKKAQELGLKWVEFDVMLAKCGEVIVFHDDTLERMTNHAGCVIDYPYSYLKTLSLPMQEYIPTLREVLACLAELKLSANIEIKALPGQEVELVKAVVRHVKSYRLTVLFSSFSRAALAALTQYLPDYPRGVLLHEWHEDSLSFAKDIKATTVNLNYDIVEENRVAAIKMEGYLVLVYTVNSPDIANHLFSMGVDGVFSDCPPHMINKGVLYEYDRIIDAVRQ